jgi:O-antigen/teichoic acid export membrane protein
LNKIIYFSGFSIYGLVSISVILAAGLIYDVEEVGVLSVIVALQYFISQFTGLGIHYSALFYDSKPNAKEMFSNHYLNVVITSFVMSSCVYLLYNYFVSCSGMYRLIDYRTHMLLFGIMSSSNKVFINQLNAKKKFNWLGAIFGIKGVVVSLVLVYFFFNNLVLNDYIFFSFLVPEILVFIVYSFLGVYLFSEKTILSFKKYFINDLSFGLKSFWGALFLDTSTKLDVLLLGSFTNMTITGVYGLITVFSDIVIQYNVFIRSYFNPEITRVYYSKSISEFRFFLKSVIKKSYVFNAFFIILIVGLLVFFIFNFPSLVNYSSGVIPLLILALFFLLTSGCFVCFQLFGQIGLPLKQSYSFLILFIANLVLNLILIPFFGMIGAALATGISYLVFAIYTIYNIRVL